MEKNIIRPEEKKLTKPDREEESKSKVSPERTKIINWAIVGAMVILIFLPLLGLDSYVMNIVNRIGLYAIMALGLNILVGYTGLVSLGQAGFVAVGAYSTSILVMNFGINFFVAILISSVIAALFGIILGLPSLRVRDTYLTIITLGFGEIIRTIIIVWDDVTNGPLGIRNIPAPSLFGFEFTLNNNGFYYLILLLLILATGFSYLLVNTNTGRALRAIKGDEQAAIMMGINTIRFKVMAFIIAAVISALAGSLFAVQLGYIDQQSFTFDMSTLILSIVILGGMGTIRGMFLGSIVLIVFPEISRFLLDYRFVIYGLILVLMMRYRPQGLLGWRDTTPYPVTDEAKEEFNRLEEDGLQLK